MKRISKRELNRIIKQAQLSAVMVTLLMLTAYSLGLASIVYMFMK